MNFWGYIYMISNSMLLRCPCCKAIIHGSEKFPLLHGTVSFINARCGTLVITELYDLPSNDGLYAMHIHNGTECTGNHLDPFADSGLHLNLKNTNHPFHTGDLPTIFSNNGYSWSAVYTNRFQPAQVKGHTVIIHSDPDDYHSQPSGSSGEKIACGEIR